MKKMKRSTFLNGYAIVIAVLMIGMNIGAATITVNHTIVAALADLWIWVILLDIMGIFAIWILIREAREEEMEKERFRALLEAYEDARNECELNALESQSPEC